MATEVGLAQLQRWMQACILHQGTCDEAIRSDAAQAEVPAQEAVSLVKPGPVLSSLERLDIYRDMYLLRLVEALGVDYPGLAHFLGAEEFSRLVARYVDAHPSQSYTLNRLGDHFANFIGTSTDLKKQGFCHDLARLELVLCQVFDADETPRLSQEAIAAVPADAWENARLKPVAAFQLIEFEYPVSEYLGAVDEENAFPQIRKRKNWVAVYRRNFGLHRLHLTRPAHELLSALAGGKTLGDALFEVCVPGRRPAVREAQLFEWFRDWMSEGLFQAVEIATE